MKKRNPPLKLVQNVEELDQEEIVKLLMDHDGNVTKVSGLMRVDPARLRLYVHSVPALARAVQETMEQGVDAAVAVLFEGLKSETFQNRFYSAKEMLKSSPARKRGFGREMYGRPVVEVSRSDQKAGAIVLKWIEPTETPPAKTIEGTVE